MNYATSCVDFMHSRSPLHDGIAHALTPTERAKLIASGAMKLPAPVDYPVQAKKGKYDAAIAAMAARPDSARNFLMVSTRGARFAISQAVAELLALDREPTGEDIERVASAHKVREKSLRNYLWRQRARNRKASLAGRQRYVITSAELLKLGIRPTIDGHWKNDPAKTIAAAAEILEKGVPVGKRTEIIAKHGADTRAVYNAIGRAVKRMEAVA